jgi:hypothetical protein
MRRPDPRAGNVPAGTVVLDHRRARDRLSRESFAGGPTALAEADIPAVYLALYMRAAQACPGLPWSVLAGIGKVESNHGRSQAPDVHSGANGASAAPATTAG